MDEKVVSLAEQRAFNQADAALWSPRDALLAVVRDIDAGKLSPDYICIAMHRMKTDEKDARTDFTLAGTHNLLHVVGLLECVKALIFKAAN